MADPLTLGLAGVSLGRSLFGGRKYRYRPGNFLFQPNENDPALALRRRRALEEISRDQSDTTNEIGRAGLLGSSASFGVMDAAKSRGARLLEDINNDSLDKQYNQQLSRFSQLEDYGMRRSLMGEQAGYQENQTGLEALGGLGKYLGGEVDPELKRKILALLGEG